MGDGLQNADEIVAESSYTVACTGCGAAVSAACDYCPYCGEAREKEHCGRCGRVEETHPTAIPGQLTERCPSHACRFVKWVRLRWVP